MTKLANVSVSKEYRTLLMWCETGKQIAYVGLTEEQVNRSDFMYAILSSYRELKEKKAASSILREINASYRLRAKINCSTLFERQLHGHR